MKKLIFTLFTLAFIFSLQHAIKKDPKNASFLDINVEALASNENEKKTYKTVAITELDTDYKCQGNTYYKVETYEVFCWGEGEGNIECESGTYERWTSIGQCFEA